MIGEFLKSRNGRCLFCNRYPAYICVTNDEHSLRYFLCEKHNHISLKREDIEKMADNYGREREADTSKTQG